ncbi:MAG: hypothetical protein K9M07_01770 [Simkaniaceae bacterium]|nr:hypothetical protein [Simkaniaceae bacterium]MCF7851950.1 hypothetical protein [Simkaniaceae bacterium]
MSELFPASEGPHADYGVSLIVQDRAKLELDKDRLAKATDPFHAFYYMIAEHLDVQALAQLSQGINVLAGQLSELQVYVNSITDVKAAFMAGQTEAPGVPDIKLRIQIATFINKLVGQPIVRTNGVKISYSDFQLALKAADGPTHDPIFSPQTITKMIQQIMTGFKVTSANDGVLAGFITLKSIWDKAESGGSSGAIPGMPYPPAIDGYLNAISSVGGYVKGIAGVETTNMNYQQKHYLGVLSFLKSMFGYYYGQLQAPVKKTQQAGS